MSVAKEAREWDTLRSGTWVPSADLPVWDTCHPSLDRPPAGPDRQACPGRAHQPGDRRPAVHQPPYRRVAPGQRVHKTRHHLPRRPPLTHLPMPLGNSKETAKPRQRESARPHIARRGRQCGVHLRATWWNSTAGPSADAHPLRRQRPQRPRPPHLRRIM